MSNYPITDSLPRAARALRPMRIDRNEDPVHYEATTFRDDPYAGCALQIRRMEAFGMLIRREVGPLQGSWFLDVLDEQGDILDTLEVNARGVQYMRRTLYMLREETAHRKAMAALAANSSTRGQK